MRRHLMFFSAVLWLVFNCGAQQTAFTYQGRLIDNGVLATGTYDLTVSLWNGSSGSPQIGGTLTNSGVAVNNGLFTVTLDFGSGVFSGAERWLEIGVRTNGSSGFVTLIPRQKLTATPYAITAGNVTGTLASASLSGIYPNAVTLNNPANQFTGTFNGGFTGNGGALSNVNAATLGGLSFNQFWRTAGNAGLTPGTHFVGTMDNQPLDLRVNNLRALRLEPTPSGASASGAPNVIGGSGGNIVGATVYGATIGGGGAEIFSGTPHPNRVSGNFGTVSGGRDNTSSELGATVGGGINNAGSGVAATVSGGIDNRSSGHWATVGGGETNRSIGGYGTVGGGQANTSGGNYATISGGQRNSSTGDWATVSGGRLNASGGPHATVGGGDFNVSSGGSATIGGGGGNISSGDAATIGGGSGNTSSTNFTTIGGGYRNTSSGEYANVGGGSGNQASGIAAVVGGGWGNLSSSFFAVVPGGQSNIAGGRYSFAAGQRARALHAGAFVWADSQDADFASSTINQFSVRASGGVVFQTSGQGISLNGQSVLSGLVGTLQLADGAVTGPKLAALSVNNSKLTLDSVSTPQLVNDSVTSAKIANGSVLAEDLNIGSFGTAFWNANGNAGTTPGLNFLGTTDNQPLEFRVNNQRALRLEPNATSPNVLGGYAGNSALGAVGASIGGGGNSTFPNQVSGNYCTVVGGQGNTAAGDSCTALGFRSTASGNGATAMGREAVASGTASVAMGEFTAAIDYCLAAGRRAKAFHPGCFVWADSQASDFSSTAPNQFLLRAAGGVGIGTAAPTRTLDVNGAVGVFDSNTRTFNAGIATEVGAQLLNVGINDGPFNRFGGFSAGSQGGFLRTDARGGEPLFGFFGRPAGTSGDVGRLGYIESSGTVRFEIGNLQKFSLGSKGTFEIDSPGLMGGRFYMTDSGEIGIGTTNPKERLQVIGNIAASGVICANNGVNCMSDRNVKTSFEPVDAKAILEKVAALPIARWRYTNDAATPHVGPVAQDFYAAFAVGADEKHIATVDADGVALAAIQGLDAIVKEKEARIASLEKSVAELKQLVSTLSGKR